MDGKVKIDFLKVILPSLFNGSHDIANKVAETGLLFILEQCVPCTRRVGDAQQRRFLVECLYCGRALHNSFLGLMFAYTIRIGG